MATHATQLIDLYSNEPLVDMIGIGETQDEADARLKGLLQTEWSRTTPDAGQRVMDAWWDDIANGEDGGLGIARTTFDE